jgi:pimeloyl-ACP methyl ester carboxylesterase
VVEATVRDNPDWNLIAETAALTVPTTMIGGDPEHGGIVPVTIGEWFAAANPMIDYVMLAGSGHSPHREPASYQAFLEAVLRAVEVPA